MKKLLLFFMIMCFSGMLYGQLTVRLDVNSFDIVYPSAFDKDDPAGQPIIFTLDILNMSGGDLQCKMAISLYAPAYGDLLTEADGLIKTYDGIPGNTESQYLAFAPMQNYALSNRSIINNNVKIEGSWNDVLSNIPDFEDFVMANGYFPSGTYTFTFYLYDLQMVEIEHSSATMNISNDMQVNLLAPGTEVTSGQSIDMLLPLSDNTPTFAWQSSATWYELKLWELDPSIYQSVIIDDLPDPLVVLKDLPQQYYQYDSSLPELQDEYIYIWNVIGDFTSTLGMEDVSSEYYGFKFQASGNGGGDPNVENLIINLAAIGLLDPGQLGNFSPTGQIYVNGVLITVENIGEFLTGLFNGTYVIESIVIE